MKRTRLTLLLGLLAIAIPMVVAAVNLPARGVPAGRDWTSSPPEPPLPPPEPPKGWADAERESLALLRRATASNAQVVVDALLTCEAKAGAAQGRERNIVYRKCATASLARADGFATSNSRMLGSLLRTSAPTTECRRKVLSFTGTMNTLGMVANVTLRTGLDAPWEDVLAASKAIRRLAENAATESRAKGWAATCRPRPPLEAPKAFGI